MSLTLAGGEHFLAILIRRKAQLLAYLLELDFGTALSQEAEVGVKWKIQRGWQASQTRTLGCLWVT
jgi:hypothetical protein